MKKINPFYSSTAWAKIRADLILSRGEKCELCPSKGSQVHHLTYERFGGDEEPGDLLFLCGTCHQVQHGLIKAKPKKKPTKAKRKMARFGSKITFFVAKRPNMTRDEILAEGPQ